MFLFQSSYVHKFPDGPGRQLISSVPSHGGRQFALTSLFLPQSPFHHSRPFQYLPPPLTTFCAWASLRSELVLDFLKAQAEFPSLLKVQSDHQGQLNHQLCLHLKRQSARLQS